MKPLYFTGKNGAETVGRIAHRDNRIHAALDVVVQKIRTVVRNIDTPFWHHFDAGGMNSRGMCAGAEHLVPMAGEIS